MSVPDNDNSLRGMKVLITGAGSGLGAAQSRLFAGVGAEVIITDINSVALREIAEELRSFDAIPIELDVASEAAWQSVAAEVGNRFGRIDALVNNAGISIHSTFDQCSLADWQRTIDINQTGVFLGIKYGARMMSGGSGSIVNISSVAGMIGYFSVAYTASKWAVRGMTKSAAMEYADRKIRVNSVHPGFIRSPMTDRARDRAEAFITIVPTHRFGEAEEVANAVAFLCSPKASFITGAELAVDGGMVAGGGVHHVAETLGVYGLRDIAADG